MMTKTITLTLDDVGMECMVHMASHEYKFYGELEKDRRECGFTGLADEYKEKADFWKRVLEAIGADPVR